MLFLSIYNRQQYAKQMTRVIACLTPKGIVIAPDSLVPFQLLPLANVSTVPHRIGLETLLDQQQKNGTSLKKMVIASRQALEKLAQRNTEQVSGPFYVAVITAQVFQWH